MVRVAEEADLTLVARQSVAGAVASGALERLDARVARIARVGSGFWSRTVRCRFLFVDVGRISAAAPARRLRTAGAAGRF
jgi:hypothetical protein